MLKGPFEDEAQIRARNLETVPLRHLTISSHSAASRHPIEVRTEECSIALDDADPYLLARRVCVGRFRNTW